MIMKPTTALNKLKTADYHTWKNQLGDCYVEVFFEGFSFVGGATLHPEDREYNSDIVGFTIAHMRAIKQALIYLREEARNEYYLINKVVCDILQCQDAEVVDPTFKFRKKAYQAKKKWNKYQVAVNAMNDEIREYIANQDKAISSIKRQRKMRDKEN